MWDPEAARVGSTMRLEVGSRVKSILCVCEHDREIEWVRSYVRGAALVVVMVVVAMKLVMMMITMTDMMMTTNVMNVALCNPFPLPSFLCSLALTVVVRDDEDVHDEDDDFCYFNSYHS